MQIVNKIVNFIISDKRAHSVANIFIEEYGSRNKLVTEVDPIETTI